MRSDSQVYVMHCPNCQAVICGTRGEDGRIRSRCTSCGTLTVRTIKSRRHDVLDIYAPEGYENLMVAEESKYCV